MIVATFERVCLCCSFAAFTLTHLKHPVQTLKRIVLWVSHFMLIDSEDL